MPEKKKISAVKSSERRMSKPQAPKSTKAAEPVRATIPVDSGAMAVTVPLNSPTQLNNFEAAMKLFHARNLSEARELFQQAAEGPERDVAQPRADCTSPCATGGCSSPP